MKRYVKIFGNVSVFLACFGFATLALGQNRDDVFQGKLFPPNVILENQAELKISKEQFTKIRAAVVDVQSSVAEHEWDMREAYLQIVQELNKMPIDEDSVLEYVNAALLAENKVKKQQITMLVRIKNLLSADQVAILAAIVSE